MVNKEAIKLWVKALRSGRYRQATDTLRYVDSSKNMRYCCLGVACNLYTPKHKVIKYNCNCNKKDSNEH